ncbi:MAG: FAD-binding oxidoreductase, partial [Firmicutes bacterium]|nr:FAD-binding oxidoreductase [Bacillota bacterium]
MDSLWDSSFSKPPQSYWLASVQIPQFEQLNGDIDVDVAIVGGGIVGIASAFALKQSGLKVAVVEAAKVFHGTTGHTTAKLTAQHDIIYSTINTNMNLESAQQYADANRAALMAVDETIRQNNIQCDFSWQPAYVFTQNDNEIQKIQDEAKIAS